MTWLQEKMEEIISEAKEYSRLHYLWSEENGSLEELNKQELEIKEHIKSLLHSFAQEVRPKGGGYCQKLYDKKVKELLQ